jgi:hypothetical protein
MLAWSQPPGWRKAQLQKKKQHNFGVGELVKKRKFTGDVYKG